LLQQPRQTKTTRKTEEPFPSCNEALAMTYTNNDILHTNF
jgi:hypothetical protein